LMRLPAVIRPLYFAFEAELATTAVWIFAYHVLHDFIRANVIRSKDFFYTVHFVTYSKFVFRFDASDFGSVPLAERLLPRAAIPVCLDLLPNLKSFGTLAAPTTVLRAKHKIRWVRLFF